MIKLLREFKAYLDNYETAFVLLDMVRTEHSDLLAEELESSGHFVHCNSDLKNIKKPEFWKKYPNLDWVVVQGFPDRFPATSLSKLAAQSSWNLAILASVNNDRTLGILKDSLGQPTILGNNKHKHWLIWSNYHA